MKKFAIFLIALTAQGAWANYIKTSNQDCQVFYENQNPTTSVTWSGACTNGYASGQGELKWFWNEGEWYSTYVGKLVTGKRHGQGTMTFSGNKYEGQWQNDKYHGNGTFTYASGEKYEGQYQDGKRHGQGTMTFPDGDEYEGQWQDGKRHGNGTYTYANGDKYEGQWQNDKYHGNGTFTYANGWVSKCRWKNGEQVICLNY